MRRSFTIFLTIVIFLFLIVTCACSSDKTTVRREINRIGEIDSISINSGALSSNCPTFFENGEIEEVFDNFRGITLIRNENFAIDWEKVNITETDFILIDVFAKNADISCKILVYPNGKVCLVKYGKSDGKDVLSEEVFCSKVGAMDAKAFAHKYKLALFGENWND